MTFTLSERSLLRLKGLHPDAFRVVKRAITRSRIDFTIPLDGGVRSLDRQKELVALGKSKTMNSRHLTGHAFDVVAIVDGMPTWDTFPPNPYAIINEAVQESAEIEHVIIEWGGTWRWKDWGHFQLPWLQYPLVQAAINA